MSTYKRASCFKRVFDGSMCQENLHARFYVSFRQLTVQLAKLVVENPVRANIAKRLHQFVASASDTPS